MSTGRVEEELRSSTPGPIRWGGWALAIVLVVGALVCSQRFAAEWLAARNRRSKVGHEERAAPERNGGLPIWRNRAYRNEPLGTWLRRVAQVLRAVYERVVGAASLSSLRTRMRLPGGRTSRGGDGPGSGGRTSAPPEAATPPLAGLSPGTAG